MLPFDNRALPLSTGVDFSRLNALRSLLNGGAPPMRSPIYGSAPPLSSVGSALSPGAPPGADFNRGSLGGVGAPVQYSPPLWGARPPLATIPYGNFSNLAALQSLAPNNL